MWSVTTFLLWASESDKLYRQQHGCGILNSRHVESEHLLVHCHVTNLWAHRLLWVLLRANCFWGLREVTGDLRKLHRLRTRTNIITATKRRMIGINKCIQNFSRKTWRERSSWENNEWMEKYVRDHGNTEMNLWMSYKVANLLLLFSPFKWLELLKKHSVPWSTLLTDWIFVVTIRYQRFYHYITIKSVMSLGISLIKPIIYKNLQ